MAAARDFLSPMLCLLALAAGCGGGGGGAPAQDGNGGANGNAGDLSSTFDTSQCQEVPAALAAALSEKLTNITLSHVYLVKQSDDLFYVSGRMEGSSQAGSDIATFALTSDDPTSAQIYAVGPNASNHSDFEGAGDGNPGSGDDPAAVASTTCARTQ
jgi:hypothetical protein